MHVASVLRSFAQALVLGLAMAFIAVLIWPELLPQRQAVELRQIEGPARRPVTVLHSYAPAVEKSATAVVNINTAKRVSVRQHPLLDDPVFRRFFGPNLDELITPQQRVETSLGSGVIVSPTGHVLTNHHVIADADEIQVTLRDGRSTAAKLIGTDPDTDLAVLRVELADLPAITLGRSEDLRIGDVVLAIGNPFGIGQTVTMGIVSATGRSKLGINTFENFIQTDAAINPGNSGGALVDSEGNLVGISTAIASRSGGSEGVGFAIPVSVALGVLQDIIEHGRPLRGWLGLEAFTVSPALVHSLGLGVDHGVVVWGVLRDGPAHAAGVRPGDVILAIDGQEIGEAQELLTAISQRRPGTRLRLRIARGEERLELVALATERPPRPVLAE